MAVKSGGFSALEEYVSEQARKTCGFALEEVYQAINFFLAQYYNEWTPKRYQRSNDFLHSAFKSTIKKRGNGWYAEVGIDYDSLTGYENATGLQVVTWANERGNHGNFDASSEGANTAVWQDAMDSTINSGQLLSDCITFLRAKGLTVIG